MGLTLREVYALENGEVLVETYYGYGKVTFRFFSKEMSATREWSIVSKKKTNPVILSAKRDPSKKYAAKITLDLGSKEEIPFQQVLAKDVARDLWETLIEYGFEPTKETKKKL